MLEYRPTIATEVERFDYNSNPAARRSGTPKTPTAAQRKLWAAGAERNRRSDSPVARKAFRRPAGSPG